MKGSGDSNKKLDASKELQKYNVKTNDINTDSEVSIFKQLSTRYKQTAYKLLFKKKEDEEAKEGKEAEVKKQVQ